MPFEVIDSVDALTDLIEFRTSPVYELILSIRTLVKPSRLLESWVASAKATLSPELWVELIDLYQNYSDGGGYFEFPVDYADHGDVPGFFAYMRSLSPADFMHYYVGRIIPRDEMPDLLRQPKPSDVIRARLLTLSDHYDWYTQNLDAVLKDISAFKQRVVVAWEAYWEAFMRQEMPTLEPIWAASLIEKQTLLAREGGRAFLEKVVGKAHMPHELPVGTPYTSITVIPVCWLPSHIYQFFGYGNVTILFNPQYTEAHHEEIKHAKEEAIAVLKALDDDTRLKILRLIAQHGSRMHGKTIAERLKISASAVSRHLGLLKEGNLIAEDPRKNGITYRFQKETLTGLVDKLLDYLYG
jgi:DNA-binding transcriptional ArsR family regulator